MGGTYYQPRFSCCTQGRRGRWGLATPPKAATVAADEPGMDGRQPRMSVGSTGLRSLPHGQLVYQLGGTTKVLIATKQRDGRNRSAQTNAQQQLH